MKRLFYHAVAFLILSTGIAFFVFWHVPFFLKTAFFVPALLGSIAVGMLLTGILFFIKCKMFPKKKAPRKNKN